MTLQNNVVDFRKWTTAHHPERVDPLAEARRLCEEAGALIPERFRVKLDPEPEEDHLAAAIRLCDEAGAMIPERFRLTRPRNGGAQ